MRDDDSNRSGSWMGLKVRAETGRSPRALYEDEKGRRGELLTDKEVVLLEV